MNKSRVLSRLQLKNWHSIHDASIDLTPLTVFIGANSSGKTNIIDALHFVRQSANGDVFGGLNIRGGIKRIAVLGHEQEPVEVKLSFAPLSDGHLLDYTLTSEQAANGVESVRFSESLQDHAGTVWLKTEGESEKPVHITVTKKHRQIDEFDATEPGLSALGRTNQYPDIQHTHQFFTQRWQLLNGTFMPPTNLRIFGGLVETNQIEPNAVNTALIIRFLQNNRELFDSFQADLSFLLNHVEGISIKILGEDLVIHLHENPLHCEQAVTISSGTLRTIAMLTAYYALDMRSPELPGLVVIEEPDTGIHPLLLKRLVEQMRDYTSREQPRQFILTTHNPMFLNYFEPQEVRIVSRDEQGLTTVSGIDEDLARLWLEQDGAYNLGDLWTTRLLGGVPA